VTAGTGFWSGPGWWGLIGFLFMVGFWTLVILLVIGLIRGRGGAGPTGSTSALRLLEERYARGEINRDEFVERRATLTGQRSGPGPPTEPTPPATDEGGG
jgi:putative membrane protein